jgi:hypothetical protein
MLITILDVVGHSNDGNHLSVQVDANDQELIMSTFERKGHPPRPVCPLDFISHHCWLGMKFLVDQVTFRRIYCLDVPKTDLLTQLLSDQTIG